MEIRSSRPVRGGRGFLSEEEKANQPKITKELLWRIASFLKPYWKQMALIGLAILLSSVLGVLPAVLTGRIIDEGLIGQDLKLLIWLLAISFGVTLSANLIGVFESYLNSWSGEHLTFDMINRMYRHLQSMPHQFFTTNNQGDIITRMTSDISGVQQIITGTLTNILSNVMTLTVALVAMYQKKLDSSDARNFDCAFIYFTN